MFVQVALAVEALHKIQVAHRDIKAENVLLMEDAEGKLHAKLTDFAFSKLVDGSDSPLRTHCGTVEHMAPQLPHTSDEERRFRAAHHAYSISCDIWALGSLLYFALSGTFAYSFKPGKNLSPRSMAQNESERQRKRRGVSCRGGGWGGRRREGCALGCESTCDTLTACLAASPQEVTFYEQYWEDVSDEAKALVLQLMAVDPKERPTATEVLQSDWMTMETSKMPNRPLRLVGVLGRGEAALTWLGFKSDRTQQHLPFACLAMAASILARPMRSRTPWTTSAPASPPIRRSSWTTASVRCAWGACVLCGGLSLWQLTASSPPPPPLPPKRSNSSRFCSLDLRCCRSAGSTGVQMRRIAEQGK